eukprot:CAMPEP_0171199804 /NCGR_PEP_ID=MMETSP0790-20130122/23655_1 /TAXON_ID=2925 /ORGANISM="Alexandrium catenella, Strain OF101" /LENGTH=38 /DNA_ID= /DNA_START= /DNA_END= /DNA_ORIENTATION=
MMLARSALGALCVASCGCLALGDDASLSASLGADNECL